MTNEEKMIMVRSKELALERNRELMIIPKIINFSSEEGHEYKFLLAVDASNKFATATDTSDRTSLEVLEHIYLIDTNEYPNAIDEVIKRSLTLKDFTAEEMQLARRDQYGISGFAVLEGISVGVRR